MSLRGRVSLHKKIIKVNLKRLKQTGIQFTVNIRIEVHTHA